MKLTLRKVLLMAAALFGLLVFVFSFIAAYRMVPTNGHWEQFNNFIWGSRTELAYDGSSHTSAPADAMKSAALPIVGAIFAILAAVCLCVMIFAGEKIFKNEKVRMIVIIAAGGLMVLGGIFTFFARLGFEQQNFVDGTLYKTVQDYRNALANAKVTISCALPIVSGILAILGGGAAIASQFIPDKKLGK